jgi:hypothetical protein
MRYVKIPQDVVVVIKGAPVPVPQGQPQPPPVVQTIPVAFAACLGSWLDDRRVGRSHQTLRYAARIDNKMQNLNPGDELVLEDTEWAFLCEIVREREMGNEYNVPLMRRAMVMLDAVLDAPNDEEKAAKKTATNSETKTAVAQPD